MTVSVRWARAADLAGTRRLSVRWVTSQKIEGREVVIAEEGGRIIGALRFVRVWDRAPLVEYVVVDAPERGRGVGSALVSFLANELRAAGYQFLLSSAQSDEPEPQRWHRRMGFSVCGAIVGLDAPDTREVFFRLDLEPRADQGSGTSRSRAPRRRA